MKNDISRLKLCLLIATICILPFDVLGKDVQHTSYWNQFRGPNGDGKSDAQNLTIQFTESRNVRWKTPIHDRGWSSPVIWNNQIWLTTATADGHKLYAVCVDRKTGQIVHDRHIFDVEKPESIAAINSYASPTSVIVSSSGWPFGLCA